MIIQFEKGKLVRLHFVKPELIAIISDINNHNKTITIHLYNSTQKKIYF